MSIAVQKFEGFGGLDLRDSPDDASAFDLKNVDFVKNERVFTRAGFTLGAYAGGTGNVDSVFAVLRVAAETYVISGTDTPALQVYDSSGVKTVTRIDTTSGTSQPASAAVHNFAAFGDPSNEYVYIANGTDQIRRFQPSTLTFTAPAGLAAKTGRLVAVTPWDNRLVTSAASSNPSRVWFSDAGAPETFGPNNSIDLTPGDGERIMALVPWRDLLFVFKASKFFVFYTTDTNANGDPIFRYRPVDSGRGIDCTDWTYAQRAVCACPEGVFFANRQGIFLTTGGAPVEVSQKIRPFFTGTNNGSSSLSGHYLSNYASPSAVVPIALAWYGNRLFVGLNSNAAESGGVATGIDSIFVYDPELELWAYWTPVSVVKAMARRDADLLLSRGTQIHQYNPTNSSVDYDTAIASKYRQGFWTPDSQDAQAVVRELLLEGSGTVTVKGSTDWGSLGSGTSVTLGTAPAVAEGRYRVAQRGRHHSYEFSATSGLWSLERVQAHIRDRRPVTSK